MIKNYTYLLLACCFCLATSCATNPEEANTKLELDHIVIFSSDTLLEESLKQGLFTVGEKLTTKHANQGTYGHYYIFYNSYIEFLYLENEAQAIKNEKLFKSKYRERWIPGVACPFGFGFILTPFDSSASTFPLTAYQSLDSQPEDYYLMSKFNTNTQQPMIYASSSAHAYRKIESLNEIDQKMELHVREDFKNYLTHPCGIKNLTKIIVTVPERENGNIDLLQQYDNVEIKTGNVYALTLIFDNQTQGKEISLQNSFELKIKY